MPRWLPPLSRADVLVLLTTLTIIFTASRLRPLGKWLDDHFGD
ncbi:MAG: hypothetical protein ACYCWW_06995 [Deltaproteobacteria bacterium]